MVRIGEAYCDENGKAKGGKAGDQTGKELRISDWRDFGQTYVYRFKDTDLARLAANKMIGLCNSRYVGYDQSDRTSLTAELESVDWVVSKLKTMCETDCSALVAAVCKAVGVSISPDVYSGNIGAGLLKTGDFDVFGSKGYIHSYKKLRVGDILVRPGHHVAMVVKV